MKILVAVDGSDNGVRAARFAADLALRLGEGAEVLLLYADPPLLKAAAAQLGVQGVARYHDENGEYALKKARSALKRAKVDWSEMVVVGDPAASILKFAKAEKAGLVVMGTHGRGALKSLFVGSVAMKVIGHCEVPVTVVR